MRFILFCISLLFLLPSLHGQSKRELERKRKNLLQEIKTTTRLLNKIAKDRNTTYDRYVALQEQIKKREVLIQTLNEEIIAAEESIVRTTDVVASLSQDIEDRKTEYGRTLRSAYRFKKTANPILFILSAETLNQAFRRFLFLRKYNTFRKRQSDAIEFTRKILAKKLMSLEEGQFEKKDLLVLQEGQKNNLQTEMQSKNTLLEDLKKNENTVKSDLEAKQKAYEKLNAKIENIIQAEIEKQKVEEERRKAEEERKKAEEERKRREEGAKPKPIPAPKTDDFAQNTKQFRAMQGKLPFPVSSGFISRSFGMQPHPTVPNIKVPNNGIDIQTDEYSIAYSVFGGEVLSIFFVPGHDYTVMLKHGSYFTVYTNLQEVRVQKGETVFAGDALGRVSMNPVTGVTELHFEVWKEKQRLNPVDWLQK